MRYKRKILSVRNSKNGHFVKNKNDNQLQIKSAKFVNLEEKTSTKKTTIIKKIRNSDNPNSRIVNIYPSSSTHSKSKNFNKDKKKFSIQNILLDNLENKDIDIDFGINFFDRSSSLKEVKNQRNGNIPEPKSYYQTSVSPKYDHLGRPLTISGINKNLLNNKSRVICK